MVSSQRLQGFGNGETTFIDRLSRDHTGEDARVLERNEIADARDAATCDDRRVRDACDRDKPFDVGALQHAVARNVGHDEHCSIGKQPDTLFDSPPSTLRPTTDGHFPTTVIEADSNRHHFGDLGHELWCRNGC